MNSAAIGKVNDISGFFAKYNELKQAHFQSLFGDNLTTSDIETLDYCLSDLYGARFLQSRFNDVFNNQSASECMTRIVTISDRMFFENWIDTKRAIEKALTTDLEKPLGSTRNGENSTENKVNAFDSETASDTDESKHSYSETKTYSNGKTTTQNAESQIDFSRNNDFLEIIINDVLSVACTSVYDDNYICERTQGGGSDSELENRVEQCESDITAIKSLIPSNASTNNKLATMADVQSGYDDTEIRGEIAEINKNINSIHDDLTDYATKAELQAVENQIPDVSNFATKTELQGISDLIPSNAINTNKLATIADIGGGGVNITKKVLRYTSIHSFQWSATTDQLRGFDTTEDFSDNAIYFAYVSGKSFTSSQITITSIFKAQSDSTNNKLVADKLGVQLHNTGGSITINVGDWLEVTLLKVS